MEPVAPAITVSIEEDWELCNDDGFVHKRKKRHLDPAEAAATRSSAVPAEEIRRRERRRRTLLKVRAKYRGEIEQWEVFSNSLRAVEERTRNLREQYRREEEEGTASRLKASESGIQPKELSCALMVDDLLSQVEAQEAIICNVFKLCDIAGELCKTEDDRLKQRLIDLPIWASPRELMASLCDE